MILILSVCHLMPCGLSVLFLFVPIHRPSHLSKLIHFDQTGDVCVHNFDLLNKRGVEAEMQKSLEQEIPADPIECLELVKTDECRRDSPLVA